MAASTHRGATRPESRHKTAERPVSAKRNPPPPSSLPLPSPTPSCYTHSVPIDLRPARPDDVPALGRICYEAFKDISDRHGFPTDFHSVEFAQQVVGMLVAQEDVYSIRAFEDGQL